VAASAGNVSMRVFDTVDSIDWDMVASSRRGAKRC
jgi:hypothetical protein